MAPAVDLSNCYLHNLGTEEAALLGQLRERMPEIVRKAQEGSEDVAAVPEGQLTIWKVKVEERSDASDIILLKYLRAEELDVEKAAERVAATLIFRGDCKIDILAEAELPDHFQGHDFIPGCDHEGRPIMISRFGSMDIDKVFGDLEAFVRYRAKLMENAIALLSFEKGAAEDLTQVHDYGGVLGSMYKSDVKNGVTAISKVFGEHYPEFKGKTLFVNFPAMFAKPFKALVAMLPERTRNKFVVLGQDDHEALFEHLAPEFVPDSLGGLSQTPPGPLSGRAKMVIVKARGTSESVTFDVREAGTLHWEVRVCTLDVAYEVAFAPASGEEEIVAKNEEGNLLKAEDGVATGSWTAKEAGTVNIRFRNENAWFKRRVCVCRAGVAQVG